MSPAEVCSMSDTQIIEMMAASHPAGEAIVWLASVISDPALVEGVNELRRRYCPPEVAVSGTAADRHPHARSVKLDPDRWRAFFFRRRLTLMEIGPMIGKSDAWASAMGHKARANFFSLDEVACVLGMHVEQLIDEVATEEERARFACV
jgi:hypothetical protein